MTSTADVAIVGGGVIGCAIARALADELDTVVCEAGQVAGGATARSAGLITMSPSYSDYPSIAEHTDQFFRTYDGSGDFVYTQRESIALVPPDEEGASRRRVDRLRTDGIGVEFLEPEAVLAAYPGIDMAAFAGAIRYPDTGWVDPYTLATSLQADAVDRGATVMTGTPVESVTVDRSGVTGVRTDDGRIEAETVIVAAGWRTPEVVTDVIEVPIIPYRTQCIVLDPGESVADLPIGWVPGEHAYFRPELNGDLLVGGWSFAVDDPAAASRDADEAFRDHVADLLPRIFTDMGSAGYVDGWAGIDGATPDTRPIIDGRPRGSDHGGPADVPTGLVVASGFHGRGVMTAPVAATAAEELVLGEDAPFPLDPFSLDRFESRSRDFEFHSISS